MDDTNMIVYQVVLRIRKAKTVVALLARCSRRGTGLDDPPLCPSSPVTSRPCPNVGRLWPDACPIGPRAHAGPYRLPRHEAWLGLIPFPRPSVGRTSARPHADEKAWTPRLKVGKVVAEPGRVSKSRVRSDAPRTGPAPCPRTTRSPPGTCRTGWRRRRRP